MSLPTNYKDDILNTEVNEVRRYNVKKHSDDSVVESDVYLEDITDYTQEGSALGASGVNAITTSINSLNNNLTNSNNEVFRFGYDAESGKRGYIVTEEGADTFYPFKSEPPKEQTVTVVGTCSAHSGSRNTLLVPMNEIEKPIYIKSVIQNSKSQLTVFEKCYIENNEVYVGLYNISSSRNDNVSVTVTCVGY